MFALSQASPRRRLFLLHIGADVGLLDDSGFVGERLTSNIAISQLRCSYLARKKNSAAGRWNAVVNEPEPIGAGRARAARSGTWARHHASFVGSALIGLFLLIGCTLLLDVFHGIHLGEDRIAYQPIYRLRQSLAVAISRLHEPPTRGYLAYKSVVDVLAENGFALFDGEPGVRLDARGWDALIDDGPRLDRIIRQARDVPVDPDLAPQIIEANELGLADYIYLGFRLFGDKITSFYSLFFLIAAASCLIYVLQFRDSPFLLFLLGHFSGRALFSRRLCLQRRPGSCNTVSNSRLFSGLSLLPAMHVLVLLWRR